MRVGLIRSRQAARRQRGGLAARTRAVIDQLRTRAYRPKHLASSTVRSERSAVLDCQAKRPSFISPGAAMALDLAAHRRLLDSEPEKLDSADSVKPSSDD